MRPAPAAHRDRFRAYSLEGAMLYFHPATGTSIRVENDSTRDFVRSAPRVVMMGATNACNLRCSFCSRDPERASAWSVDDAARMLEGLAAAGTLEVAFGGGEPFAFRGFEELLHRLYETTSLALNVTTNGTLLSDALLARLAGVLGQVRLSLYDDTDWRAAARKLTNAHQRWGANVLVDPASLLTLDARLGELARLGATDVSLLSYVGPDAALHLSPSDRRTLEDIVAGSPLPLRVSVCFGGDLDVPRLLDGENGASDCGAGHDFVTVTSDKRVQGCSFQDDSVTVATAHDVLRVWRDRQTRLLRASPRRGCTRTPRSVNAPLARHEGLRIWQGFSGNNSGECVMVARFAAAEDVTRVLSELLPGYAPGEKYSEPWLELFRAERVDGPRPDLRFAPDELVGVGRSLIAHTASAVADDFPELRALAWKRGGFVRSGIHVHEQTMALLALRARDSAEAKTLAASPPHASTVAVAHGRDVIAVTPLEAPDDDSSGPLAATAAAARAWAAGRPLAFEVLYEAVDVETLREAVKRLGNELPTSPRLKVAFWGDAAETAERAERFAQSIDNPTTRIGGLVVVDPATGRKRLAVLAHRAGAHVAPLESTTVVVEAMFWHEPPPRTKGKKAPNAPTLNPGEVRNQAHARLVAALGPKGFTIESCERRWGDRVSIKILTASPGPALAALDALATELGVSTWPALADSLVLERAIRRVLEEVSA